MPSIVATSSPSWSNKAISTRGSSPPAIRSGSLLAKAARKASRMPPTATPAPPTRRHEQGVDVVLFGTGNRAHVKDNVDSILRPPLAPQIIERLHASFGHLNGVGLDRPGPVKK